MIARYYYYYYFCHPLISFSYARRSTVFAFAIVAIVAVVAVVDDTELARWAKEEKKREKKKKTPLIHSAGMIHDSKAAFGANAFGAKGAAGCKLVAGHH